MSNENHGDGRPVNLPGVYRNPDGVEVVTSPDPNSGRIQADALIQQGFKRVGDKPETKTETKK